MSTPSQLSTPISPLRQESTFNFSELLTHSIPSKNLRNLDQSILARSTAPNKCSLNSIIIDTNFDTSIKLHEWISQLFPEINNLVNVENMNEAQGIIFENKIDLIFSEAESVKEVTAFNSIKNQFEIIAMSENSKDAIHALRNNLCGFISKPLDVDDVAISIQCAITKLMKVRTQQKPSNNHHLPHDKLVGIPTMEGIEFINTDEIIRCEGLQKCTRIITVEKSDIISSYNIGEFRKLLEEQGFFSCHKSHLINLKFVKKYTREGFIFFNTTSKPVPLARRKKYDFLSQMRHL